MTAKPSIKKTLLFSIVTSTLLTVVLIGYFWISNEYSRFRSDSVTLKNEYMESQKDLIRSETEKAIEYIEFKKSQAETRLRMDIRNRAKEAYDIAMNIYREYEGDKAVSEIKKIIKDALRPIRFNNGRGYYFATRLDGVEVLFADRPELEGKNLINMQDTEGRYVIKDMIDIVRTSGEGFYEYTWTKPQQKGKGFSKIAYIVYFKPFDWLIGTGEYLDDIVKDIQSEVIERLEKISFGEKGYVFAGQWDGLSLSGPAKGKNMIQVADANGVKIVEELIRAAKNGGGFVSYVLPKFKGYETYDKLSYAMVVSDWQWYVGAGINLERMDEISKQREKALQKRVRNHIFKIVAILFSVLALALIVDRIISRKIYNGLKVFSRFFEKAATESIKIDTNKLYSAEFDEIARSANEMVRARAKAESAVRESEKRLATIMDSIQTAILVIDADSHEIVDANPVAVEMIHLPKENIVGQKCNRFICPQEVGKCPITDCKETLDKSERKLLNAAGEEIPILKTVTSIQLEDRACLVESFIDITDRKRAEEALKKSEERMKLALDSVRDAVWDWRVDTGEVYFSTRWYTMLGYDAYEMPQAFETWKALVHPEDLPQAEKTMSEHLETAEPFEMEYRMRTKGNRWRIILDRGRAVEKDETGKAIRMLGTHMDITERKNIEEQLRQAQKMEAVGTLAGGIAHDFNNILTPILVHADMALLDLPESSSMSQSLVEIKKAGHRAKELVKQILTFSRQTEQQRVSIDLAPIIEESLKLLRASLPTTIEIKKNIQKRVCYVLADPTQIQQVVMNLCTNGAQAMRERGGALEVALEAVDFNGDDVKDFHDITAGRYIRLRVSDKGSGIAPDVLENIFDPFFTTKPTGEGTGMGLAVVHGIVQSHGGTITVDSKPGEGTIFTVFLPRIEKEVRPERKSDEPLPTGNERILFVDDEEPLVLLGQKMLERLGYKVETRTSSIEALAAFRNHPGRYQLVLTDMTMPNMTGEKLTEEILRIRPDIPIIICTGFSQQMDQKKACSIGIRAFIMKPFVISDVAETVRKVLDATSG